MYLLELYEANCSTRGRGGSILTYASQLVHILRYCFRNQIGLVDLTDTLFSHFVRGLNVSDAGQKPRSARTVVSIGETTLRFLEYVGQLYGIQNFVGPEGTIRIIKRSGNVWGWQSGKDRTPSSVRGLSHRSFPVPSPLKRGFPIGSAQIEQLRSAIFEISSSGFLVKRRQVMLLLLEITGGRRSEVSMIRVESVKKALGMRFPLLTIPTVKRGGNLVSSRQVPVSRVDLAFVDEYIEVNRRRVVRRTIGLSEDHGFLFVGERGGKPLSFDYLGTEVWKLKREARIDGKAHSHMFRHRFITKLFKQLIEVHRIENPDAFRQALFNVEGLKQQVMQWTGHRSVEGLTHYIHLAFREHSGAGNAVAGFRMAVEAQAYANALDRLASELTKGADPAEIAEYIRSLSGQLKHDTKRDG